MFLLRVRDKYKSGNFWSRLQSKTQDNSSNMNSKILIIFALVASAIAQNAEKEESAANKTETADTKKDKRGLHGLGYAYNAWDSGIHLAPDTVHSHSQVTITKEVPVAHPVLVPIEKHVAVPYAVKVPVAVPVDRPYPVHVPKPYPVEVTKHVPYPVDRPYAVPAPYPVKVAVPAPYAVRVPQPYAVPVVKHVPVPVSQPIILEKHNGWGLNHHSRITTW